MITATKEKHSGDLEVPSDLSGISPTHVRVSSSSPQQPSSQSATKGGSQGN